MKVINLDKETFQIGESYFYKSILEIIDRNKGVVEVNEFGSKKPRKRAIHIRFTLEDTDLWFIQDNYNSYRCVMFEN